MLTEVRKLHKFSRSTSHLLIFVTIFSKCKNINMLELKLLLLIILTSNVSQLTALRSPYFVTGKYKATDVDSGKWKTVGTIEKVT